MRWPPGVQQQAQLQGIFRMSCHSRCVALQPTCPGICGSLATDCWPVGWGTLPTACSQDTYPHGNPTAAGSAGCSAGHRHHRQRISALHLRLVELPSTASRGRPSVLGAAMLAIEEPPPQLRPCHDLKYRACGCSPDPQVPLNQVPGRGAAPSMGTKPSERRHVFH